MSSDFPVQFGFPVEWAAFGEAHNEFLQYFPNLENALYVAFRRNQATSDPTDRVVFFLGGVAVEDFMEILLLAGNGHGIGALKILRGMYERCVTARYLRLYPEETDKFLDFYHVSQYKLGEAIKRSIGLDVLPTEKQKELKYSFDSVRDGFMVTACDKCGTKRLNHTWSNLDFVSMAAKAGAIGKLIVPGYYLPLRHAHSTVASVLRRTRDAQDGGLAFDERTQRSEAEDALRTAHNLLLNILELQKEHFSLLALEQPLQQCFEDFIKIWKTREDA